MCLTRSGGHSWPQLRTLSHRGRQDAKIGHMLHSRVRLHQRDRLRAVMSARTLFVNACYGPNELKILCKAFEDAWEQIAPGTDACTDAIEAARYRLATLLLGLANDGCVLDAERLARAAVQLMWANLTQSQRRLVV